MALNGVPATQNHELNVPPEGYDDWDDPLNDNFSEVDRLMPVRDKDANKSEYDPKHNAKFEATDTGDIYFGDGSSWNYYATLDTGYDDEAAQDAIGAAFDGTVSYDDANNTLSVALGNALGTDANGNVAVQEGGISHDNIVGVSAADHHTRYTNEEAQDAVGTILGTQFSYDDTNNAITLNQGSGSALDADTLDALDSASFLRSDANDTWKSGALTVEGPDDGSGNVTFQSGADTTATGTPSLTVDFNASVNLNQGATLGGTLNAAGASLQGINDARANDDSFSFWTSGTGTGQIGWYDASASQYILRGNEGGNIVVPNTKLETPNGTVDGDGRTRVVDGHWSAAGATTASYTLNDTYDKVIIEFDTIYGSSTNLSYLRMQANGLTSGYDAMVADGTRLTAQSYWRAGRYYPASQDGGGSIEFNVWNNSAGISVYGPMGIGSGNNDLVSGKNENFTSPLNSIDLFLENGSISLEATVIGVKR